MSCLKCIREPRFIFAQIFFYILKIEFALQNTGWFVKRFLGSVKNNKGYKFTTWGNPIIIMGMGEYNIILLIFINMNIK